MKIALFIAALAFTCSVYGQEYRKLRMGISVGAFSPALPRAAAIEGAYRLSDRMAVGYRFETASLRHNSVNSSGFYYQFYWGRKNFRPFVTLGVAQFTRGEMSGGCGAPTTEHRVDTEKKIGIFPGVGFDIGHFSFIVDASLAAKSKSTIESTLQTSDINYHAPYTEYLTNSYVTVKIGFYIGGRKKLRKH